MTIHEGADLHKKVERYEAAVDELRAAHQEVREILTDHVLFEGWQQLGSELGFSASPLHAAQNPAQQQPHRELAAVSQGHDMGEGW